MPELLRLAAFTTDPTGGNPAGVWIGDTLPPADEMQRIAGEVGYSETAFLVPDDGGETGRLRVRYFFCEIPLFGFRFPIWPLSVPAVGSMTQLITAGLRDARDSVRALVRPCVSVT